MQINFFTKNIKQFYDYFLVKKYLLLLFVILSLFLLRIIEYFIDVPLGYEKGKIDGFLGYIFSFIYAFITLFLVFVLSKILSYKKQLILIVVTFILIYAYFTISFLLFKIPNFYDDTFQYYQLVDLIKSFNLQEIKNLQWELPVGYPLFLIIIDSIFHSAQATILIQIFLSCFAIFFLTITIFKYYKKYALLFAFVFSFVAIDGWGALYDKAFLPDSIYRVFILLLVAFIIKLINNINYKNALFVALFIFLTAITRANGPFIYFVFPFILAFLIYNKQKNILIIYSSTFIILNLFWCVYNFKTQDIFMFSYVSRFNQEFKEPTTQDKSINNNEEKILNIKKAAYIYQLNNRYVFYPHYNFEFWNYWFYSATRDSIELYNKKGIIKFSDSRIKEVYKEYYDKNYSNKALNGKKIYNYFPNKTNIILKRIMLIMRNFYKNILFLLLYYTSLPYFLFMFFKSKFKDNISIIGLIVFLIHILSLGVLVIMSALCFSSGNRYEYVTSFCIYFNSVLLFYNLISNINNKCSTIKLLQ